MALHGVAWRCMTDQTLVGRGPNLSSPAEAQALRATGTDNATPPVGETPANPVSPAVSPSGGIEASSVESGGSKTVGELGLTETQNPLETMQISGDSEAGRRGRG